jgi:hypothetical protein
MARSATAMRNNLFTWNPLSGMFIEGKRKKKGIVNGIVKIYHYKEYGCNETNDIIYESTT